MSSSHDLNGPLYILNKTAEALTTYLDFNGRPSFARATASATGIFRKLA